MRTVLIIAGLAMIVGAAGQLVLGESGLSASVDVFVILLGVFVLARAITRGRI